METNQTEGKPQDAQGFSLHEGDRVFALDLDYKRVYGTLQRGETFRGKQDWYVDYDDGETAVVLDFNYLWRADKA